MTFKMIFCCQLCGNNLIKTFSCFSMTRLLYKARSIQKWFIEIGVEELDWPTQSPDLTPIEHLWDELECRLRVRFNCPISVPDLTNALVADWKLVPAALFQHLVESLPKRVKAVIAANWGPTPF